MTEQIRRPKSKIGTTAGRRQDWSQDELRYKLVRDAVKINATNGQPEQIMTGVQLAWGLRHAALLFWVIDVQPRSSMRPNRDILENIYQPVISCRC